MAGLLTIVVPVFNEADSLEPLHAEIVAAVGGLGPFEVVYVDDGSTDRSPAVLERLAAAHGNVLVVGLRRNFGKATALTHGFAAARGDVVVTMDGDRQDDPGEVPRLLARLDEGYDLVSGWKQRRQDPLTKTLPSRFFNWTVRRTTGLKLHDFNCGLKAYRREVVESIHVYGELHRYIPVLADDAGFRVTEEKVTHRRRTAGYSKYGWRRYMRGYLDLFTVLFLGRYRHRPQHLFGGLGTLMVLIGVGIDVYLTVMKILGQAIGSRPLFVFANLLIVVGVQLFSVGLVSELLAFARAREGVDDYEVARRIDRTSARRALGPDGTRAALAAAAATEFGDEPTPEEMAARERREADRRRRQAARAALGEPTAVSVDAGSRADALLASPTAPAGSGSSSLSARPADAAGEARTSDDIARRARLKAERFVAEAERTMGGDLKAAGRDHAGRGPVGDRRGEVADQEASAREVADQEAAAREAAARDPDARRPADT